MNPEEELKKFRVIDGEGNLVGGIWRNSAWQELHITTNPLRIEMRELDDDQRIMVVTPQNAPPWAEVIVKYIYDRYG